MLMEKYDLLSSKAQNFMNQEKIEQNLRLAADLSKDEKYLSEVLSKAKQAKGLNAIEATSLLLGNIDISSIFQIASEIKELYYGNRIVLFAPLYLSNYCINSCTYCPYHVANKAMPRKK